MPHYAHWDRGERFAKAKLKELAALGVLVLRIPEKFGGHRADFVTCGVLNEEIARGDFNYTLFLQIEAIITMLLVAFAEGDIQAEWLPRMAAGKRSWLLR